MGGWRRGVRSGAALHPCHACLARSLRVTGSSGEALCPPAQGMPTPSHARRPGRIALTLCPQQVGRLGWEGGLVARLEEDGVGCHRGRAPTGCHSEWSCSCLGVT